MGTRTNTRRSWAKGWLWAMLAVTTFSECADTQSDSAPQTTVGARLDPENLTLWKEIIYPTDSTACSCTYKDTYTYLLSHPDEFRQCKRLMVLNETVDCKAFKILLDMEHLEGLTISEFGCRTIPESITRQQHLTSLSLDFPPGVDTVPSILFRVPNLDYLNLYGKTLAYFEKDIPIAPKLELLDFGLSPIKRLPMTFGEFPELGIIVAGTPDRLVENDAEFRKAYPDMAFDTNILE